MADSKIRVVMYYTRSENPHDHQITVTMSSHKRYRFDQGEMKAAISHYGLSQAELLAICEKAFKKAHAFIPDDESSISDQTQKDWDAVQNLLCELQKEAGLF